MKLLYQPNTIEKNALGPVESQQLACLLSEITRGIKVGLEVRVTDGDFKLTAEIVIEQVQDTNENTKLYDKK